MKKITKLLPLIFIIANFSFTGELDLEKNFKAGDTISAATFNEILATIEKINKVPKDSDLVGTWSCSGTSYEPDVLNAYSMITLGEAPYQHSKTPSNITLTLSSSGTSTSLESPYTFTQSAPLVVYQKTDYAPISVTELNGEYVLRDSYIIFKANFIQPAVQEYTSRRMIVKVLSPTRISFEKAPHEVICDKQ